MKRNKGVCSTSKPPLTSAFSFQLGSTSYCLLAITFHIWYLLFNSVCIDRCFCRYSLCRNKDSRSWISIARAFPCVVFFHVFLFPSCLHFHRRKMWWWWYNLFFYRKNLKSFFARHKMLQWTSSYVLPDFPYDVKCILAEKKCPDHSMRIRIIEFLQADMTKYLEGSL